MRTFRMTASRTGPGFFRRNLPAGLILLFGAALSALIFQMKEEAISARHRAAFSEIAHEYARTLQWEFNSHLDAVRSLRDFVLASPSLDNAAFSSFASRSLERAAGLRSLQWIPLVAESGRRAIEGGALQDGSDPFEFHTLDTSSEPITASPDEFYLPVYYSESRDADAGPAVGFDYGSNPVLREAFNRAQESGKPVVTAAAGLMRTREESGQLLLVLPVVAAAENNARQIRGFVAGRLDLDAIETIGLRGDDRVTGVRILDQKISAPQVIFSAGEFRDEGADSSVSVPFAFADQKWIIRLSPSRKTISPTARFESWSLLTGGLLFTAFCAIWIRQRQDYVQSIEAKVSSRTAALSRINEDLQTEMAHRRKAEQELKESEARFRQAFRHAPTGVGLLSPAGRWIQVNEALVKMTGFSAEQLYQSLIADALHPDEVDRILANIAQMAAGELNTFALEQQFRKNSGEYLWVILNVSAVRNERRELLYFIVQIVDITSRNRALEETRRAKEFSENIIRSSSDGIFAFDLETRVTVWNSGMEAMTGITAGEAIHRKVGEVLPFLIEAGEDQVFQRVLAGGIVRSGERPFSLPERGRSGYFAGNYAPFHDGGGGIIGGVGVVRDVTEQREARERLRAFAELLKQRNRELQDFAYVASHDLQEPLRKVRAFGDRLEQRCRAALDEQGLDYLNRMRDAAGRMQTLISDLLAFSRISTQASPFTLVDLNDVAREVISDLESTIEETGAVIDIGELPVVEADATQMRQLLQNLISNAIKYRKSDVNPRVEIRARRHAAEEHLPPLQGAGSLLFIKDNGIGFEEKYLDRIFTVFQRLHGRNEYPGTGIGLAICRKIAERHKGWITATSRPGEGSTFIVGLPHKQNGTT